VGKEAAIATKKATKDLFQRLRPLGFDEKFIRRVVLPDWWEDSLAEVPANRALAEMAIARHLDLPLAALRRPECALDFPALPNVCLKRAKDATFDEVKAAIYVAKHAAELTVENLKALPPFTGTVTAAQARSCILQRHDLVTLATLLEFCWSHGIVVVHLSLLPKLSRKIQGMALFVARRPVLVLASGYDAPPRLAFHLGHELGHLFLEHVKPGDALLADGDLNNPDDNPDEKQADEFSCEILTGKKNPTFDSTYNLRAQELAEAAARFGRDNQIDPGTVALCYGYYKRLFGSAQAALNILEQDQGAHQVIAQALQAHLDIDNLPDSSERFLSILTSPLEGSENG
jgi:hypothetical protein